MQGDDDQVVPYKNAALLQDKLLKNSTLKVYPGYPHGMHTTNADAINADLPTFNRAQRRRFHAMRPAGLEPATKRL